MAAELANPRWLPQEERIADLLDGGMPLGAPTARCILCSIGAQASGGLPSATCAALFFLPGARGFLRETLLAHGLIRAAAPFSPRERQVLALLLTDANEKEVAQRLAIGYRTAHQHAEAIYRHTPPTVSSSRSRSGGSRGALCLPSRAADEWRGRALQPNVEGSRGH